MFATILDRDRRVLRVLQRVFKLMQDPEKICVGVAARDAQGNSLPSTDTRAVCFCSLGAIKREALAEVTLERTAEYLSMACEEPLRAVVRKSGFRAIQEFHDACALDNRPLFLDLWQGALDLATSRVVAS